MIGKWIDGLTDVQRDRIIEGQGWCNVTFYDGDGALCLIGHAFAIRADCDYHPRLGRYMRAVNRHGVDAFVPDRFDELCVRFGRDRIVRACKLRAAAGVVVPVETANR